MATPESVSSEIIDLMKRQGSVALSEVEKRLNVPFNVLFMAIDKMAQKHLLILERQGGDYILSPVG